MPTTSDQTRSQPGDPYWLQIARRDIGLREIPGHIQAPRILAMWRAVKAPFIDDETPWCGGAVGAWMTEAGIAPPPSCWRAKAWLDWGKTTANPVVGTVVVFGRAGGGHVALAVGRTRAAELVCLGGNQGNAVSIAAFNESRVLGFRLPAGDRMYVPLPIIDADASPGEA